MSTRQEEMSRRSFITAAGLAAGAAILWPTGSAEAATDPADLGVVDALVLLRPERERQDRGEHHASSDAPRLRPRADRADFYVTSSVSVTLNGTAISYR